MPDASQALKKTSHSGCYTTETHGEAQQNDGTAREKQEYQSGVRNTDGLKTHRQASTHRRATISFIIAQANKVDGERKEQWGNVFHTSRALTKEEKNYGKMEEESLAVYSGIKT